MVEAALLRAQGPNDHCGERRLPRASHLLLSLWPAAPSTPSGQLILWNSVLIQTQPIFLFVVHTILRKMKPVSARKKIVQSRMISRNPKLGGENVYYSQ